MVAYGVIKYSPPTNPTPSLWENEYRTREIYTATHGSLTLYYRTQIARIARLQLLFRLLRFLHQVVLSSNSLASLTFVAR